LGAQAFAQAVSNSTKLPLGIYKVNAGCTLFNKEVEKVRVTQKQKILNFLPYNDDGVSGGVESIYLGSGSRKASGTDGSITWTFSDDGQKIVSSEKFSRVGSGTWPDLERSNDFTIQYAGADLAAGAVRIVGQSVTKFVEHLAEIKDTVCSLQSLANDKNQVQISNLKRFAVESMQDLVDAMPQRLNFDQAALSLGKAAYTNDKLSKAQIQELASLELMPAVIAFKAVELKTVPADANFEKIARNAFDSALSIANEYIKEGHETQKHYAPFFAYLKRVEGFLEKAEKAGVKVYQVDWSEGDADGRGLLIIDPVNKEVLYIGAAYFV
jgi:hypothetical protein